MLMTLIPSFSDHLKQNKQNNSNQHVTNCTRVLLLGDMNLSSIDSTMNSPNETNSYWNKLLEMLWKSYRPTVTSIMPRNEQHALQRTIALQFEVWQITTFHYACGVAYSNKQK